MLTGPVRGGLTGQGKFSDKAYFFAGTRYWRYDMAKDYGELRYPLPLARWKLPGAFATGIDATLDGSAPHVGKAYLFKDDAYVRYDWDSDRVDYGPAPISAWGLTGAFATGVDAALNGQGPHHGKAYFFKDDAYVRYDWDSDTVDSGPAPISAWKLGPGFGSAIGACLMGPEAAISIPDLNVGRPKAYFFKGGRYVRYDWLNDSADPGYPLPITAAWPSGLAVWAEHVRATLSVCEDARLEGGANRLIAYPGGTTRGQAGWQLAVRFSTPARLADHLEAAKIPKFYGDRGADDELIGPGRITRLAINAHGGPGVVDVGENVNDLAGQLTVLTIPSVRGALNRIGAMLAPGAPVIFMGCNAGQRSGGDGLLTALSLVWGGHEITAFTTIGYSEGGKQIRHGEGCDNPGMRDTDERFESSSQAEEDRKFGPIWNDLTKLPWAHERSRHAKSALNGMLTQFDADE
jgi:hypothetical protein